MKGIIFTSLQEMIENDYGIAFWDTVLASCGEATDGIFISFETYPDSVLLVLIEKITEQLGISLNEFLVDFGIYLFPRLHPLAKKYSAASNDMFEFLSSINSVIHTDVKKLYLDSTPPTISVISKSKHELILKYQSKRELCSLMFGMLHGAAHFFGNDPIIKETQCTKLGDDHCTFILSK